MGCDNKDKKSIPKAQLQEVSVKIIKKEALLFSIESAQYRAIYEKALGELKSNQVNLALAKINVKRYRPLVAK